MPHAAQGSDRESDTVVPTDHEAGPSSSPEVPKAKAPTSKAQPPRTASLRKRSVDTQTAASTASNPVPHDVHVNVASTQPGHHPGSGSSDRHRQEEQRNHDARTWLQLAESCVNYVGPYDELREAEAQSDDGRTEVVLARLVAEWQAIGQMVSISSAIPISVVIESSYICVIQYKLIGLAAVNTAVIGFVKGSTAFTIDDFSLGAVTIGAIAAGLGMAMDAWFFFLFSGADVAKFKVRLRPAIPECAYIDRILTQRLAKDVYGTYFFFCLVCRLPTIHMFVSVLALGLFLLSTAWVHSPTTALVIFCVFGVFVGSQTLAYVLRIRFECSRVRPRRTLSVFRL